jgi:hypothetical protein
MDIPLQDPSDAAIFSGRSHLCHPDTTITLATDSAIVYYVLNTGKGLTLRQHDLLQQLYISYYKKKSKRGHRLVFWWVATDVNLADPVSRGVLAI